MLKILTDPISIATIICAVFAILAVIIPLIANFINRQIKKLTYRVLSDTSIVSASVASVVQVALKDESKPCGIPISDVDLLVLSVKNTGSTNISIGDYLNLSKLAFSFPQREVVSITEVETEPDPGIFSLSDVDCSKPDRITLGCPELNKKATITLSILLRGSKDPEKIVQHFGSLRNGRIQRYQPQKGISRSGVFSIVGSILLVICLGFFSLHTFISSSSLPSDCSSGSIAVGGSTALLPLIQTVAHQYQSMCPLAKISANQDIASSEAGLRAVETGSVDIGDSDLRSSNLSLVDHPVAVAIYTLILNQSVSGVTGLTTAQIRDIYDGTITRWNQAGIGGPNLPIFVVSRTSTSGTRATFEQYVLHSPEKLPLSGTHIEVDTTNLVASTVANTPGAIGYVDSGTAVKQKIPTLLIDGMAASPDNVKNGRYLFWTVEHMYSKGNPTGLARAFVDYITGDEDKGAISDLSYVPFNDVTATSSHPSPLAPDDL